MAGYGYFENMSNNAKQAFNDGLITLQTLKKQDLIDADISISLQDAKELAKTGHWQYRECHHIGRQYNEVPFYDLEDLVFVLEEEVIKTHVLPQIRKDRKEKKDLANKKPHKHVTIYVIKNQWARVRGRMSIVNKYLQKLKAPITEDGDLIKTIIEGTDINRAEDWWFANKELNEKHYRNKPTKKEKEELLKI